RCGRCGRKSPAPICAGKNRGSGLEYAAMRAVEALKAARAAGVELALDGDDLALKAASAPPAAVLDALSLHKAEIMVLLRPAEDGWSAEDWQVFFEERAGIVEFDGGLPRAEAEAIARREMATNIHEMAQAGHDAGPYAPALAVLCAKCPVYVHEGRWRQ